MRRLLVAAAVALVAGQAPTLAAAAKLPRCLAWADPKGDAGLASPAVTGDPMLDLTKVVLAVRGDVLVTTMTVAKMADNAQLAYGDRFQLNFTFAGKRVEVYYKRSRTREAESTVFYQQGVRVDNAFATDAGVSGVYNAALGTMTLSVKLATLKSALGKGIANARIGAIAAVAYGSYVAQNFAWDSAPTSEGTQFRVAACA